MKIISLNSIVLLTTISLLWGCNSDSKTEKKHIVLENTLPGKQMVVEKALVPMYRAIV